MELGNIVSIPERIKSIKLKIGEVQPQPLFEANVNLEVTLCVELQVL